MFINELERMCKLHDEFCSENTDTASRNISNEALTNRANEIANSPVFHYKQKGFERYVAFVMRNKARFGFGINSKKRKEGSLIEPFEELAEELHKTVTTKFQEGK
jgi:hypothetical protein